MNQIPASQSPATTSCLRTLVTAQFLRRLENRARRYLGDDASAQDAVQATLEAMLRAKTAFRGESAYSTYAFGILKHKIGDALRERKRFIQLDQNDADGDMDEMSEAAANCAFAARGFTGPEGHAHALRLGNAIQTGLQSLTPRGRQAFLMRERQGLDGAEISVQLGITLTNTWVLLCRARRQLRASLVGQGYGIDRSGVCDA